MKIGFLLPTVFASRTLFPERIFAPGPLARDTINELVNRGHEVTVFAPPDFESKGKLISGDIVPFEKKLPYDKLKHAKDEEKRIRNDEVWKRSFEIALVTNAYKIAQKEKFDIMHSYHDFLFTPHYVEELTQIPTVYTLHDPMPPEGSFEYHEFQKFTHHQYVSISDAQRRSNLSLNFAATVYHGIRRDEYPYAETQGEHLLFMGRPIPEKGLHAAIAGALAANTPIQIGTHFPGAEKETEYYKKDIEPFLTNPLVSMPGIVSGEEKKELYKQAKALLFPIQWEEPFGMVMIEAMVSGTPVIAYNRGSVSEIVRDGVTGFIIEPDDKTPDASRVIKKTGVEGLVEAILRIGEIDRAACRKHVEEHFTVEKMVTGYEEVYNKIRSSSSSKP